MFFPLLRGEEDRYEGPGIPLCLMSQLNVFLAPLFKMFTQLLFNDMLLFSPFAFLVNVFWLFATVLVRHCCYAVLKFTSKF